MKKIFKWISEFLFGVTKETVREECKHIFEEPSTQFLIKEELGLINVSDEEFRSLSDAQQEAIVESEYKGSIVSYKDGEATIIADNITEKVDQAKWDSFVEKINNEFEIKPLSDEESKQLDNIFAEEQLCGGPPEISNPIFTGSSYIGFHGSPINVTQANGSLAKELGAFVGEKVAEEYIAKSKEIKVDEVKSDVIKSKRKPRGKKKSK